VNPPQRDPALGSGIEVLKHARQAKAPSPSVYPKEFTGRRRRGLFAAERNA